MSDSAPVSEEMQVRDQAFVPLIATIFMLYTSAIDINHDDRPAAGITRYDQDDARAGADSRNALGHGEILRLFYFSHQYLTASSLR